MLQASFNVKFMYNICNVKQIDFTVEASNKMSALQKAIKLLKSTGWSKHFICNPDIVVIKKLPIVVYDEI